MIHHVNMSCIVTIVVLGNGIYAISRPGILVIDTRFITVPSSRNQVCRKLLRKRKSFGSCLTDNDSDLIGPTQTKLCGESSRLIRFLGNQFITAREIVLCIPCTYVLTMIIMS